MIVVLGSINIDIRFEVERLPQAGETIHASGRSYFAGGKGANQALAARRAGADVALLGATGKDEYAEKALSDLIAADVDISGVATVAEETGSANIYVDREGENIIVVTAGANGHVDAAIAGKAVERAMGGLLVLQQELPTATTMAALELARAAGVKTILNVSPFGQASLVLSQLADIVIANESEWSQLGGEAGSSVSMQDWSRQHGQTLVVTRGAGGVCVASPEDYFEVAAPKISPLDTVGAGDTFCGYLAAALDRGASLREAAELAVAAASLACLVVGAQSSIPTREATLQAMRNG